MQFVQGLEEEIVKAEDVFNKYQELKKEQKVLKFQISRFKGITPDDIIESMTFSHAEGERVQTSGVSDKTGKIAVNYKKIADRENDEWFSYLISRLEYVNDEIDFFEYALKELSDKIREIIWDMVIVHMSWADIEEKYHISHAALGRYRKNAIKELEIIYGMRDKQTEIFMLK